MEAARTQRKEKQHPSSCLFSNMPNPVNRIRKHTLFQSHVPTNHFYEKFDITHMGGMMISTQIYRCQDHCRVKHIPPLKKHTNTHTSATTPSSLHQQSHPMNQSWGCWTARGDCRVPGQERVCSLCEERMCECNFIFLPPHHNPLSLFF